MDYSVGVGSVQFQIGRNQWMWDGVCYSRQLFGIGGIMITLLIIALSTGYFGLGGYGCLTGGIGATSIPYFVPNLSTLFYYHKNKRGNNNRKRPIRVYMDGCFDLMHYGHANALRQAKSLGDELVVGVVSDEEIIANKGPPVLSMEERLILVSGLKWVDEVIANAPYDINEKFMNILFNDYKIDYIIHGDDPCLLPDGTDAYALAKKAGRYKQIKRTEGVSSTDIVGRILSSVRSAKVDNGSEGASIGGQHHNEENLPAEITGSIKSHLSHFLPTSRRIVQFSNGKGPGPNARVVYIDGAFDLFHAGHVEILRSARQLGDFLLVGIHSDQTLSQQRGSHPIMHLHERSLSVLACRYVDEVIIGAPCEVTQDMITTFNIALVVHGTVAEGSCGNEEEKEKEKEKGEAGFDPYLVPKRMGIFQIVTSPKDITSASVAQRIINNHEVYKKRNLKKKLSEDKYYSEKKYVSGD